MATVPRVTGLTATAWPGGPGISLNWNNNLSDPSYYTEIWKSEDGTSYYYYETQYGSDHGYDDYTYTANAHQWYKILAYATGYDRSESDPAYAGLFSDTLTEAVTCTDSYTDEAFSGGSVFTETVHVYDSPMPGYIAGGVSGYLVAANAFTETVTVTDTCIESATLRTDFGYYLCGESGGVYKYSGSSTTDGGATFAASWTTKAVDFADMDPGLLARWKTIYGVTLHYEDVSASASVSLGVSVDGGATFTALSASLGTGARTPKDKVFHTITTGQYFQFKVESSSPIKILGLKVEFEMGGDYFAVS